MSKETIGIYVDLDSLMDTRLAVLFDIDPLIAEKNLEQGFLSREYDEFVDIETSFFKERYSKRDKRILKKAVVTKIPEIILYFANQTIKAYNASPMSKIPKLVINTFPYSLMESEITNLILAMRAITKDRIDIQIVEKPPELITPNYFKNDFAFVVMYHYVEWLEIHSINQNLVKTQCPEITLLGPAMVKSKEALEELKGVKIYEAIETYTSPYFKLILYPTSYFSADIAKFMKRN